jgi:hypothetical protein
MGLDFLLDPQMVGGGLLDLELDLLELPGI